MIKNNPRWCRTIEEEREKRLVQENEARREEEEAEKALKEAKRKAKEEREKRYQAGKDLCKTS